MPKRYLAICVLAVVSFGFSSAVLSYACGWSLESLRKESPKVDPCAPIRSFDFKIRSSWERDGKIDSEVFWEMEYISCLTKNAHRASASSFFFAT